MLATMSMGLQAEAQTVVLDTSNVVVGYHYSCNTKDAEGRAAIDEYDIALLIGKKIVAQKGFCELSLDEDDNDDYVRILTERQHHVPEIYIGFPDEDKVTIRETVLMDDFEMVEKYLQEGNRERARSPMDSLVCRGTPDALWPMAPWRAAGTHPVRGIGRHP